MPPARLAALTGQAAAQTQQAGQAAGAAAAPVSALAGDYEQAATSLDRLRAAQEAWQRVQRGEAALHGDLSEQLQIDIANARQSADSLIEQSLAADNAALSAQNYYESLKRLGGSSTEAIEKAREVAEARRAEAESTAAAAVEAGQYLLKLRAARLGARPSRPDLDPRRSHALGKQATVHVAGAEELSPGGLS